MQKYINNVAITNSAGQLRAISGALITVTNLDGSAATIYANNGGAPLTDPLLSDATGYFEFYAADGRYTITISKVGITTIAITDVLLEDPADPSDEEIKFLPDGAGAIETTVDRALKFREVCIFSFMTEAQITAYRAKTYADNLTPAAQAGVALLSLLGGGDLIMPAGGARLDGGVASSDGYKNGILLPDTDGDFATKNGITIRGEGVNTILRAGSTDMIVVRASRLNSGADSFMIDGAGLSNVIGLAPVPESLTQTTELTSQSFGRFVRLNIENCTEGTLLQPGPRVLSADSGGFYHQFYNCTWNSNTRHVWMKKDVTAMGNRTTRTSFFGCTFMRGNTGVMIDGGTEINFYGCNFELINTGVTPSATPTAFNYTDTNPANIRFYGGYAEACTRALESTTPGAPQIALYGFEHNSTKHSSEFLMGRFNTGRLTVPKLTNVAAYINAGGEAFAGFVIDPDQTGSKVLEAQTNSAQRWRVDASGTHTFYGSVGNVNIAASGANISFTRNSANSFSATGASATINYQTNTHNWQTGAGVGIFSATAAQITPTTDNALPLGIPTFRWSSIAAREYLVGAGATKILGGAGSPEGVETAPIGSIYLRSGGSTGTSFYVKESGAGNTGWVGK